jgi:4-amino-4-deoxy-L-arabinose transferase-like glycosyltransferase
MQKTTRLYLSILVPAMTLSWIFFKCCYPFADFFSDSYTYIQAAADHDSISYRPIGYSVFLRLLHALSASDTFLVTVQYAFVQSACLLLFFYLRRYGGLAGWAQWLVAAFLVLDPLVYYISNYVSSDALFLALSLCWLTLLLELVRRPTWGALILQWIVLALIFYTRYVALFYPLAAALTFLMIRRSLLFKVAAISGSIAVVAAGVFYTRQLTLSQTGAPIFSAFSGWQMANNALHIYPWLPPDTTGMPSPADDELVRDVTQYFEQVGRSRSAPAATTAYMWEESSPLHRYFNDYRRRHSHDSGQLSYFIAWNRVAPVFTQYGYGLLRRHPIAFGRYYLWPSAKSFFLPPLDVFAVYNEGKTTVDPVAQQWFRYRSARVKLRSATVQATILAPFPWAYLMLNFGFLLVCGIYFFSPLRALSASDPRHPSFTASLKVASAYLFANACFNIFASPSVFRYQVLPLILLFIFTIIGLFYVSYPAYLTNDKLRCNE